MSRIIKGDNSIFPDGILFKFIKLITPEDIRAAKELQSKHEYLIYNIIIRDDFSYAGPFTSVVQIQTVQSLINARSDQIRKYTLREKEIPDIWKFLFQHFA